MNHQQATGKTIQEAFEEFHKANPHVYRWFIHYAFKAINAGKTRISFKLIMNVIRWEVFIGTMEINEIPLAGGETRKFKINNNYESRYARLFALDFPEHRNKIEFRTLKA